VAEDHGLNAGVFDATIPVASCIQRVIDKDEQVKELLESKSAFLARGL
jgi:hypothetical protein